VVLRRTRHKIGPFRDVRQPISWLGMEEQNLTLGMEKQQKHTLTNQKMYNNTKTLEMERAYFGFGAS